LLPFWFIPPFNGVYIATEIPGIWKKSKKLSEFRFPETERGVDAQPAKRALISLSNSDSHYSNISGYIFREFILIFNEMGDGLMFFNTAQSAICCTLSLHFPVQ
jgi:hypothetical protein